MVSKMEERRQTKKMNTEVGRKKYRRLNSELRRITVVKHVYLHHYSENFSEQFLEQFNLIGFQEATPISSMLIGWRQRAA